MMKIFQMFKETSFSLFSDGKVSMKRVLAWLFGLAVLWMTGNIIIHTVPADNQNIYEHCFDGLLMAIAALLGAATWQDVKKDKNKSTVEQTVTETPPTTVTETTVTPPAPENNQPEQPQ